MKQYKLYIPSEEYEDEIRDFANENNIEFDAEPESNITTTELCMLAFAFVSAAASACSAILQKLSLDNEKVILVTPKGVYKNITLEQAKEVLEKEGGDE